MINYRTKPDLSQVLSIILPDQEQTWLLRSCLLEGRAKSEAWTMLLEKVPDLVSFLKQDNQGIKRLLPLLFHSLQRGGVEVESSLLTILRVAAVHEELRTKVVRHVCREILSSLRSVNGQIMILKGVVLAEMVYIDRGLRHCHDLDIFIGQSDVSSVGKALESLGIHLPPNHSISQGRSMTVHHETGFPVSLHRHLFPNSFFNGNMNDVRARSQTHSITGVQVPVLSPEDNLLHTCGLMFCRGNRESLLWACDSWLIINQFPGLDWDVVCDCAKRQCLTYPLSVTLGYLAEELNAPIPDKVLDQLCTAASGSPLIEREVVLHGVRGSAQGGIYGLDATSQKLEREMVGPAMDVFSDGTICSLGGLTTS